MKSRHTVLLTLGLIAVLAVSGGLFALADNEGTESDPLITKSYLEEQFRPQVEALIDDAVAAAAAAKTEELDGILADYKGQIAALVNEFNGSTGNVLDNEAYLALLEAALREKLMSVTAEASDETAVFRTVTLSAGQRLYCLSGAELFLREGKAVCISGLMDVPAGGELAHRASLKTNTLYIATEDRHGLRADSDVTVFLRGGYVIE
ncbi:MAG: hypothetical protein IJL69_01350 [Oscillospiraceae bacterium]|nr:hypothetical protein [Oscillospiraceae bacterium]